MMRIIGILFRRTLGGSRFCIGSSSRSCSLGCGEVRLEAADVSKRLNGIAKRGGSEKDEIRLA